jgi:hypothetical protein
VKQDAARNGQGEVVAYGDIPESEKLATVNASRLIVSRAIATVRMAGGDRQTVESNEMELSSRKERIIDHHHMVGVVGSIQQSGLVVLEKVAGKHRRMRLRAAGLHGSISSTSGESTIEREERIDDE